MSLLIITGGGAYFTNFKACVADSKQLIQTYHDVRSEIAWRRMTVGSRLVFAQTLSAARSAVLNIGSENAEFKDRPLDQLLIQLQSMPIRIVATDGLTPLDNALNSYDRLMGSTPALNKFQSLTFGQIPEALSPADLPSLQLIGYAMYQKSLFDTIYDIPTLETINCGPRNVVKILLGGNPQTVQITRMTFLQFEKMRDAIQQQSRSRRSR